MNKDMKRLKLLSVALVATCLCACSSGGSGDPDNPTPTNPTQPNRLPISISANVVSRVTDTGFNNNDHIGLFVVNRSADGSAVALQSAGNQVDNMLFTYNGTWSSYTPIYWKDETTHADFYIYYPFKSGIADVTAMTFQAQADQSAEYRYKRSEILVGSAMNVAPTEEVVVINARHLMSQLVVSVVPGNGFTPEKLAAAEVAVKINQVKTKALVNIGQGTVVATGDAASVTPLHTDGKYKALIVPQTVEKTNLVTVTVDGRDYNLSKAFTFESGKSYQMTVTVNKTSSGINVNITKWNSDGTDYGGIAE